MIDCRLTSNEQLLTLRSLYTYTGYTNVELGAGCIDCHKRKGNTYYRHVPKEQTTIQGKLEPECCESQK
jgi:hypothetical protein